MQFMEATPRAKMALGAIVSVGLLAALSSDARRPPRQASAGATDTSNPLEKLPEFQAKLLAAYAEDIKAHPKGTYLLDQRQLCKAFYEQADKIGLRAVIRDAQVLADVGTSNTFLTDVCTSTGKFEACTFQGQPFFGFLLSHTLGRLSSDYAYDHGVREHALATLLDDWMYEDLYPKPEWPEVHGGMTWQTFIRSADYKALGAKLCRTPSMPLWGGEISWPGRMYICLHSLGHGAIYAVLHREILKTTDEHRTACYEPLPYAYPLGSKLGHALEVCDTFDQSKNHYAYGCATGVFHTARVLNPAPTFTCAVDRYYAICQSAVWQIEDKGDAGTANHSCVDGLVENKPVALACVYAVAVVMRPTDLIAEMYVPVDTVKICSDASRMHLSMSDPAHLKIWRACFAGITFRAKLLISLVKGFPAQEPQWAKFWKDVCSPFSEGDGKPLYQVSQALYDACWFESKQVYRPPARGDYQVFATEGELLMNYS